MQRGKTNKADQPTSLGADDAAADDDDADDAAAADDDDADDEEHYNVCQGVSLRSEMW